MITQAQWDAIQNRHAYLMQAVTDPSLERAKRQLYQKELAQLGTLLEVRKQMTDLTKALEETKEQIAHEYDEELKELFAQEADSLQRQLQEKQKELDEHLVTPDVHSDRSVYLEIRAGAGGKEAALFVGNLLKMYTNYALKKNWKVSIESASPTDLGGYKEVVMHIQGKDVYGHLKYESGVHRVQRVPETEASGRVHTSTATVAVLPEAQEVDVDINPADLRIDVFRASGAGGQHVNTTDSAVRITHIPTGVVVSCQDERSQHKNKAKAMKMLQARILAAQVEQQEAEMAQKRKAQVGTGMRAEKVRTYNFPQNRVTDHQANITLKRLDTVMQGDLDEIIDALRAREHEIRKEQFLSQF
jgi:peptide chain release factor 1